MLGAAIRPGQARQGSFSCYPGTRNGRPVSAIRPDGNVVLVLDLTTSVVCLVLDRAAHELWQERSRE